MAITHDVVKSTGDVGTAAEWNADHVIGDDDKPKNFTTLIVAASNSLDTTRADYVCDGIDDQLEINAAIAALPADGGRISFLEGTYDITDTIEITKSSVSLVGLGRASKIMQTGVQPADHVITVANKSGILIRDLWLVSNAAAGDGIFFTGVTDSRVEGVWIDDAGSIGINLVFNCQGIAIWGCFIDNSDVDGINGQGAEFSVVQCVIHDCGQDGMSFLDVDNCIMTNNVIYSNAQQGIWIIGDSDDNIISNNRVYDNAGNDIDINDATCDRNNVIGNNVNGAGGGIVDNGTNTIVQHNQA